MHRFQAWGVQCTLDKPCRAIVCIVGIVGGGILTGSSRLQGGPKAKQAVCGCHLPGGPAEVQKLSGVRPGFILYP